MVASNIADIAWAIQTAKGTPATSSTNRAWLAGGDQPHSNRVKADFEETTGNRMRYDSFTSTVDVMGSPELFVMPLSIGSLLYGVLGAKSVTGAADPYTHTFVPANTLPYFTFWRMLANGHFETFTDCVISHLKIHGEYGQPLRVTPTIMGLAPSYLTAAEATAAVEKTNRFMHRDASAAYLIEGVAYRCLRSFDLDIDNGAQIIGADSLTPCDVSVGLLSAQATFDALVEDFSLWKRLEYAASAPSNAALVTDAVLELVGSPAGIDWTWTRVAVTRTLEILIPRVQVAPFDDQPSTRGDPLVRSVMLTAVQPAAGASVTAKVKNSLPSY